MGIPGVESSERNIIVAASGFSNNEIVIDISVHFVNSSVEQTAVTRTLITNLIADEVKPFL